jgi:hypothetical protein
MSADDTVAPGELEKIALHALVFQKYVFRRAWGIYYAVWTVAIIFFAFGYLIPFVSAFPASASWVPYALLYGGVGVIAGVASFWIFGSAWRTLELRRLIRERNEKLRRKYVLLIALWWTAMYAAIGISFTFFEGHAFTVLYGALFLIEIFLIFQLRACFPGGLPTEGKIALASYGFSSTLSLVVSVLGLDPVLYTPIWIVTVAAWFYSSLYALRHAPDELVELTRW